MLKRIFIIVALALTVLAPAGASLAQGPTRTPTADGLGSFLGGTQSAGTPTRPSNDAVTQALARENYVVISSGNWYDASGRSVTTIVHVFMHAAAADPKSDAGIKQIANGFAALRSAYPSATTYHVLLLSGPNIYNASTTSNALQLLSTNLVTPDAFIRDVLNGIKTTSLVQGGTTATSATATRVVAQATATRAPTRVPTTASNSCNAPADKARLWVKNGYSGTMRFSVGAPDVGFQKDFDIPADGQYHFIDMPPSDKYTYSASIPGVGKASQKLPPYYAGQCYYLTFQP